MRSSLRCQVAASLSPGPVGRSSQRNREHRLSMRRIRHLLLLAPACLVLAAASPAQASQHYTVRWGDTLTWIAQAHGMSLQHLASANALDPYGVLVAGTVLRIPGHHTAITHQSVLRTHHGHHITVQWGDTLSGIAARYGTTFTHLAEMNGIDPGGVLLAGSTLIVPRGHAAAAAPASTGSTGSTGFDAQSSIDHWSAHYGVNPHLARAVAWMESGYHTGVVSSVGAWGVMQIMPDTWR